MASPCFQRPAVASYPDGSPLLLSAASRAAWSELVERHHVLGRASDDEPGAVAVTAEHQRQRPELRPRKPFDEI